MTMEKTLFSAFLVIGVNEANFSKDDEPTIPMNDGALLNGKEKKKRISSRKVFKIFF